MGQVRFPRRTFKSKRENQPPQFVLWCPYVHLDLHTYSCKSTNEPLNKRGLCFKYAFYPEIHFCKFLIFIKFILIFPAVYHAFSNQKLIAKTQEFSLLPSRSFVVCHCPHRSMITWFCNRSYLAFCIRMSNILALLLKIGPFPHWIGFSASPLRPVDYLCVYLCSLFCQ